MGMFRRVMLAVLVALASLAVRPPVSLSAVAVDDTVFVRLPAAAVDAAALRPLQAIDYGAFVWAELRATDLARLRAAGLPHAVVDAPFTLSLGGLRFDPRQGAPALPAGWDAVRSGGPDLHLVQFVGPTRGAWLDGLRRNGLEVVQYVHPFTYVVWGEAGALEHAARAAAVQWSGPFAPAYRVLPQWRELPDGPVQVDVLFYRGADVDAAVRAVEALGGALTGRAQLDATFEVAAFTLSGAQLQAAAQVPGVYSIQLEPTGGGLRGEMSAQVSADNVDGSNVAFPGYLDWLAAVGVDGAGVTIANVDAGVYQAHPDLAGRIVPCSGTTCGGSASSDHGTHTAGIMAGDGSSGVRDSYGFLRGLGVAPGASLVEQKYFYTVGSSQVLYELSLLMAESYRNGAQVSGNSWGPSATPEGYDADTRQVDVGVRDADPDAPGNQPLNYVLSIMNGYGDSSGEDYSPSSLGTPDEAKNILSVGSTYLQGSGGQYSNINDISSNSAHGPALDGRTIPHLVAPGCSVDSTIPTNRYTLMCGTSMASPHVSGGVALFIDYYRDRFGVDPSPALVKAVFLPVAHDLAGYRDADGGILGHPFDRKQGWGRLNLAPVVSPTVSVVYFDNPLIFDATGDVWEQSLFTADPSRPVRLMLVWTDAPGHGLGGTTPAWVNDLDVQVQAGGGTYLGNVFGADGWSATGGTADYRNNTEGVFLPAGVTGPFTVTVLAANVAGDGIPNEGDGTDQDFALACYNCSFEEPAGNFTISVDSGEVEVCAPGVVTGTVAVSHTLPYSYPVVLALSELPAGVTAAVSPTTVAAPGSAVVTLTVSAEAVGGDYTVAVEGSAWGQTHVATFTLTVHPCCPDAPALLGPADGAFGVARDGTNFSWATLPCVETYRFQLDVWPTFAAPLVDVGSVLTASYTLSVPLQAETCYFWRAAGEGTCGLGAWAAPFRFSTGEGAGATLVVSDVVPASGLMDAETTVHVLGRAFTGTVHVQVGQTWLPTVTLVSSTTLEVVIPAGFPFGPHDVTVVNGDCQEAALTGAYLAWRHQLYLPLIAVDG
ncbi:MAG: S8 family serine peptidase [Anaerolineae bacterium]|nr:S8 family serine peptidase [Anaerolineae bacterium]